MEYWEKNRTLERNWNGKTEEPEAEEWSRKIERKCEASGATGFYSKQERNRSTNVFNTPLLQFQIKSFVQKLDIDLILNYN